MFRMYVKVVFIILRSSSSSIVHNLTYKMSRGYSSKILADGALHNWGLNVESLTLFQSKLCYFPHHILDLTQTSKIEL